MERDYVKEIVPMVKEKEVARELKRLTSARGQRKRGSMGTKEVD
jgi:hypothetical protein